MSTTLSRAGYLARPMPGERHFFPDREIGRHVGSECLRHCSGRSRSLASVASQPNETQLTVGLMEPAGPLRNLLRVDRYFSRGTFSPRPSSHGGRT